MTTSDVNPRITLGRYGEDLAATHLVEQGMVIIARNFRCNAGEIDIIARDGEVLVVCEVKTRRRTMQGQPLEAITTRKMRTLRAVLLHWLAENAVYAPHIRFDAIGIVMHPVGRPTITHVRGVE